MHIIRPVRLTDLPQLQGLAQQSMIGITSLSEASEVLELKIRRSLASFQQTLSEEETASYFFVLEDGGELLGCSAVTASVGVLEPFYSLRNETFVHASCALDVQNRVAVLKLCQDLSGSSLLSSFHVHDELVGGPLAELTSRARLLFIAAHPQLFSNRIVAEMVGCSDARGHSPFWEAVGRKFFDMDYARAEQLCGQGNRTFLAELLPAYPIVVPMLSDAAQAALGTPHPQAQATFDLLVREGFESDRYLDVFDGGPTLQAQTLSLRSIARSQQAVVRLGAAVEGGQSYLLCNQRREDYRATIAQLHWQPGQAVTLSESVAAALLLNEGDSLRLIAVEDAA